MAAGKEPEIHADRPADGYMEASSLLLSCMNCLCCMRIKGAHLLIRRTRLAACGSFILSRNSENDRGCVA